MPILYNSQNVDERYADKLEPNLYYGSVLVPGVTCDDSYTTGPAGGIYVRRLATSAVKPGKPGRDYTDRETADQLIPILLNNNFMESRKIYAVQAAAVNADLADANLADAQAACREGWNVSGIACLAHEGTACADTTAPTAENAKKLVIDARTEIVKAKGSADVVLCSPDFYALILLQAGKEFLPTTNEKMAATGQVGVWLGMTWVECNAMASSAATYYDHTGTEQSVDLTGVDFIVYKHEAFSTVTNFETARLKDSERFSGTLAQVEQNSGFRIRNNQLVRVHKHAAA